jgi:hypothetical protein
MSSKSPPGTGFKDIPGAEVRNQVADTGVMSPVRRREGRWCPVLERLDRSWDMLAGGESQAWRDEALAAAISRVTDAMALAGRVSVQHRHRRVAPDHGAVR